MISVLDVVSDSQSVSEKGAAYPKRGLTLWRRVDFLGFLVSPERGRPLFRYALSALDLQQAPLHKNEIG